VEVDDREVASSRLLLPLTGSTGVVSHWLTIPREVESISDRLLFGDQIAEKYRVVSLQLLESMIYIDSKVTGSNKSCFDERKTLYDSSPFFCPIK
jgi:hypothetical protein